MKGIFMFAKIMELKQLGYRKLRAAKHLNIDVKTIRKYWEMSQDEYISYVQETKERSRIMDPYRDYILQLLRDYSDLSSGCINDKLREKYDDFAPSYRSVRLYIKDLRIAEGIANPAKVRQYEEVAETPIGYQAQVDMGQYQMPDMYGQQTKVFIFAMSLSYSRYKFTCFQLKPYTATDFIEAHDKAFRFFGGRPEQIVYDQDRVMVVSENHGDVIFTDLFSSYKCYAGFSIFLCRGYDPESKGKIEAVVKYIKGNFLPAREFCGIDSLNSSALSWLDRTGNGLIHETTKMIPKIVFQEEQKHLLPVNQLISADKHVQYATVRKSNVVIYKQNRYALPKGTYAPSKEVRLEPSEDNLKIFEKDSDILLMNYPIEKGKGKYIGITHPERELNLKLKEVYDKSLAIFANQELGRTFIDEITRKKPRYIRDQLGLLLKLSAEYDVNAMGSALEYCIDHGIWSAPDFKDTLAYLSDDKAADKLDQARLPLKYQLADVNKRDLASYQSLIGGDTVE
jgi:transposase